MQALKFGVVSPNGGTTTPVKSVAPEGQIVQATPLAWGDDHKHNLKHPLHRISIHAPRVGGRPRRSLYLRTGLEISIHAPRVGDDSKTAQKQDVAFLFRIPFPQNPVKCKSYFLRISPFHRKRPAFYSANLPANGCALGVRTRELGEKRAKELDADASSSLNRRICEGRAISPGARPASGRPARESAGDPLSGRRPCRSC